MYIFITKRRRKQLASPAEKNAFL